MFGWPELAAIVAEIYRSLPPEDPAHAVFLGCNYGEAAAIDAFGAPRGLPPAISGHNNYFLWGPREHDGSVVIRLGGKLQDLLKVYTSCTAGKTDKSVGNTARDRTDPVGLPRPAAAAGQGVGEFQAL
jgi:hypothetical protein